jgi:hypothetical protein
MENFISIETVEATAHVQTWFKTAIFFATTERIDGFDYIQRIVKVAR